MAKKVVNAEDNKKGDANQRAHNLKMKKAGHPEFKHVDAKGNRKGEDVSDKSSIPAE